MFWVFEKDIKGPAVDALSCFVLKVTDASMV